MGIASGIPLYLILSTLMIWLTRENIDLSTIGLFSLTQIPWSLKFLWAPIIDYYKIPILQNYLGKRKSWLLLTQFFLIISILLLGTNDPSDKLFYTAFFALLVSFFSATQDIIIDAYRIEILKQNDQGTGAAMTQAGYRVGGIIAGAGALYFREIMDWEMVFILIALFILILMILTIFAPENKKLSTNKLKVSGLSTYLLIFLKPLKEFFSRNKLLNTSLILLFILFFKLGDVVAGVMANPFYVKIGFSNIEIANASKLYGVFATLFGVFVGGWLVKKIGIIRSLFFSGLLQIISNLLFVILSKIGPDYLFLIVTVTGENISGGIGSAAFVAYLSILCNKQYTATQYALLSSIMGIARTFLSSPSGFLVNFLGWSNFFVASALFGIPGMLILVWMQKSFPLSKQIRNNT
ncbi:AmpG family muropeptide MFS transporter [Rickettsiales bacterium]|nr:AmpG family muropeptide MFS transporter [Rickettsiales bacterium]